MRHLSRATAGRRRLLSLALVACSAALALALAPSASAIDVNGDDANDIYAGTGGAVFPPRDWRGDEEGRRAVADCEGCTWHVTSFCTRAEFDVGSCTASHLDCPVPLVRVRVWLERPAEPRHLVGAACIGDSPPATRAEVGAAVRDRAERALPGLHAGVQPADGALVGVPAVFRTGQPADGIVGADLSVLGLDVRLDARARWQWSWGDGASAWTSSPGGRWPDATVAHTYRRVGPVSAEVTAVWRAEFMVEGLGPYPVPGDPLTQSGTVAVDIREARALLVG